MQQYRLRYDLCAPPCLKLPKFPTKLDALGAMLVMFALIVLISLIVLIVQIGKIVGVH